MGGLLAWEREHDSDRRAMERVELRRALESVLQLVVQLSYEMWVRRAIDFNPGITIVDLGF